MAMMLNCDAAYRSPFYQLEDGYECEGIGLKTLPPFLYMVLLLI